MPTGIKVSSTLEHTTEIDLSTDRTASVTSADTAEGRRLIETQGNPFLWRRWGPYVSERSWGTVREDYSPNSAAWDFLPHDLARSKAYRWGEDGLAAICDRYQLLVFSLAFWNGKDLILKERAFGLTPGEGNHGEDVKEYYFYLDSTPTHSYMKYLHKYPQARCPYKWLAEENRKRGGQGFEFELLDTGIFDENRYFDVFVEYAKVSSEDLCICIEAVNRGPEPAPLHILPHLWFRNTWAWSSKYHQEHPFVFGHSEVRYDPAESNNKIKGGNSNWRGPIWFPITFLIIDSLRTLGTGYGDDFRVSLPAGPHGSKNLCDIAGEIANRMIRIFTRDENGQRPVYGGTKMFQEDPYWRDLILFYEFYHGDNGAGLGASHQTGWSALVAALIEDWRH
jgi:hypothetical protein